MTMNPCCCCLSRLPEKDLKMPYVRCGIKEIFSDMLEECFQIHLTLGNKDKWGICEVCVGRLRDASDFKLQVQHSQAKLRTWLETHVKNEECMDNSEMSGGDNAIEIIIEPCIPLKVGTSTVPVESDPPASATEQLVTTPSESPMLVDVTYHCQICLRTFLRESNLKTHMKRQHDNFAINPSEAVSTSDTFEQQFTKFCLSTHKPKSLRRVKRLYTCEKCPAVLSSKHSLIGHKRIHRGKKDHSCHICGRKFNKKYILTAHIRTHTGQKPFNCEICNKKFTTNSGLTTHNRLHTGELFICDICGKQYTRKSELIIHMEVHSGQKPYECEICKMQFIYKTSWKTHNAVHSEIKSFACDVCGKQFRRKDHLIAHNVIHTREKPFSCEICDQKFSTKTSVRRHNKKVHGMYH